MGLVYAGTQLGAAPRANLAAILRYLLALTIWVVPSQIPAATPERTLADMLTDWATCEVRGQRDAALSLVMSDHWWTEPRAEHLFADRCGKELRDNQVRVISDEAVAALALSSVRAEFAQSGPVDLADRSTPMMPPIPDPTSARAVGPYAPWRARYTRLGDCVARAEPARTRAWLVTEAGASDGEVSGGVLAPVLANCIAKLRITTSSFSLTRDKLALSYYRLAHAGVVPAGTEH